MSIQTLKDGTWFLHNVDRWLCDHSYAGLVLYAPTVDVTVVSKPSSNYHPRKEHHYNVIKYKDDVATISPCNANDLIIDVRLIGQSNWDLFVIIVGTLWIINHDKYIDDEDYTDYAPLFYSSLTDVTNANGKKYGWMPYEERRRIIKERREKSSEKSEHE